MEKLYKSINQTTRLTSGLQDLWYEKILCDVRIKSGAREFDAHRVVLAASTPYFRAMLTDDFKENNTSVIEMPNECGTAIQQILDYIYRGQLKLTPENVVATLDLAAQMHFKEIMHFCEDFLLDEEDPSKCLQHMELAELYDLRRLRSAKERFLHVHFSDVAKCEDFSKLSSECLCNVLRSDDLVGTKEMDIFNSVLKWLSVCENKTKATQVLNHIRFGLMSRSELKEIAGHEIVYRIDKCRDLLYDAMMYPRDSLLRSLRCETSFQPRMPTSLVLIGGCTGTGVYNKVVVIRALDSSVPIATVDEKNVLPWPRSFAAAVACNNFVFVIGGDYLQVDSKCSRGESATDTLQVYSALENKWSQLAPMRYKRSSASAILLDDKVLVSGGICEGKFLDTAEMFNIHTNEWKPLQLLPGKRYSHAGAQVNGKAVICGGVKNNGVTAETLAYDKMRDMWTVKAPMLHSKYRHAAASIGHRMFVFGGSPGIGAKYFDMYDILVDQWTLVELNLPVAVQYADAMVLGKCIYIAGGLKRYEPCNIIHCYNTETNDCKVLDCGLPLPLYATCAVRLKI